MLVSIIIPVYNSEEFLAKALDSALNQTHSEIEVILVNDGSTDTSLELCQRYERQDCRIKIIDQENQGPGAARNQGIKQACGAFIFFLDADDCMEPNAIEAMLQAAVEHDCDLVMSHYAKINKANKQAKQVEAFIPESRLLTQDEMIILFRNKLTFQPRGDFSLWAKLYKASIIKDNSIEMPEGLFSFEDFVFILKYLHHAKKVFHLNKVLYNYSYLELGASSKDASLSNRVEELETALQYALAGEDVSQKYLQSLCLDARMEEDIERDIAYFFISIIIIFLVRASFLASSKTLRASLENVVKHPSFEKNIARYTPKSGNSLIIPWLLRRKWLSLLITLCKVRARKRYGN